MIYKEIQGDLFAAKNTRLVQCLDATIAAGAGIALTFNQKFNMKNILRKLYPNGVLNENGIFEPTCVYVSHEKNEENLHGTFNLITKEKVWYKPTLKTLEKALLTLKSQVIINNITELAMPLIGCGIDGLSWKFVRQLIVDIFQDLDIEITVYYLDKDRGIINGTN